MDAIQNILANNCSIKQSGTVRSLVKCFCTFQIADVQCRCRSDSNGVCQPKYGVMVTDDIRHLYEKGGNNVKTGIQC